MKNHCCEYEIRRVREHLEVFLNGVFCFSADNMQEVREELEEVSTCD